MDPRDRIERALDREIEIIKNDDYLTTAEKDEQIRDLERDARDEIREYEQRDCDRFRGNW